MATFTGTASADLITPGFVSPSVTAEGASSPGTGDDTIFGGLGDDTLAGGGGDDLVAGGDGNDHIRLGGGNDRFTWSPGDDNDIVEGQGGADTLDFTGANIAENISISANGSRVSFFRNVANVTMDLNGVETLAYHALGGEDIITVNALAGTSAERVFIDLEGVRDGAAGDGQADTVRMDGTDSDDKLTLVGVGTRATISGLGYVVRADNLETSDSIHIFGKGGRDIINAVSAVAGAHLLQLDGGEGGDTIIGSAGADVLLGAGGRDVVRGGAGSDQVLLGDADDLFIWKIGDGSDLVEGQGAEDELDVRGAGADEDVGIEDNGGRVSISSSVGAALLDIDDMERLSLRSGAGSDSVTVGDLTGTDLTRIDIDLAEKAGHSSADTVSVNGTGAADVVLLSVARGAIAIGGLPATTVVRGANAQDRLIVSGGLGADILDASGLPSVKLTLDIRGGDGNDVAFGSGGDDRFLWNPGDDNDTLNGRAGKDTLDFSGSAVSEAVDILSNGQQLNLLRNVASVQIVTTMVERVHFHAGAGAATISIDDLSGTSARLVSVDLAGVSGSGAGDAHVDSVSILGRDTGDDMSFSGTTSALTIKGLPWQVNIDAKEAADLAVFSAGGGDDALDLTRLVAGMTLRVDGGEGSDTFIGGSAAEEFLFTAALDAATNVDTIRHFSASDDLFLLDDAVFVGIGAAGPLAAGAFHTGNCATDAGHRIIYNELNGRLFFDGDGLDGNDAVLFAKLDAGLSLTADNFRIV